MGANYKQLTEFQKKIERLNNTQKEEFLEACCKELAARLLAKVIKRTPVGEKPKLDGDRTVKVTGASGKTKTFLTAEGERDQKYWSDYHGGTLRRGWTSKTHEEAVNGNGEGKNASEYANGLEIKKIGDKYHIDIINPVEYASYVEYGHRQTPGRYVPALGKSLKESWVPGKFMLTISEQELRNSSDGILMAKLNKFMKDVFE